MRRGRFLAATAGAAALATQSRFTTALGRGATVKIGYVDSFSGVFSDLAGASRVGVDIALADMNRRGRVKYELVYGDDTSKPATATTEGRRLVEQENVDVLFGTTSSGSAYALGALAVDAAIFTLLLAPFDSQITGAKAYKLSYRWGPNARMATRTLGQRILSLGHKWYFVQADYALGKDAYAQLSGVLARAGGVNAGVDVLPLGALDYSPTLTKARDSGADVLILCNSGLDAANTAKQFVNFGLQKRMHLGGIFLEDIYHSAIPLDALQGSTFPIFWGPNVSDSAARLTRRLKQSVHGPISARHWLGYGALTTLADRIEAAGTTDAEKLMAAFNDHSFDNYKHTRATFRACDHQAIQDMYAGSIVSQAKFEKQQFMFDIVAEVPAVESDGTCESPWAVAAKAAMAAQTLGTRKHPATVV